MRASVNVTVGANAKANGKVSLGMLLLEVGVSQGSRSFIRIAGSLI